MSANRLTRSHCVDTQDSSARQTIFGIDLGTTYSCIAYVDQYGKATVIPNAEGELITPSVVLFEPNSRIVGKEARNTAVLSPEHVKDMIKREMGSPDYFFEYAGQKYRPQEISSYILRKVAQDAEQMIGQPVKDAVITCPAYFGEAEREATRAAGELAGLNVLSIINEPTAAALDYSMHESGAVAGGHGQVAMVYDLGGGTFDVTVIQMRENAIQVIATGGDHRLGGRDWDQVVVEYLADEWRKANPEGSDPLGSLETLQDLWQKAEAAKRSLTARDETRVAVQYDGVTQSVTLTRQQFDDLTRDKLNQTIGFTRETLAVAKDKGVEGFDVLLLVGGSTRMPQVRERLQQEFPDTEIKTYDPDQAVAKGAAIYGLKLAIGIRVREIMGTTEGLTGAPITVDGDSLRPVPDDDTLRQVGEVLGLRPDTIKKLDDTRVTNVTSHSYGIEAHVRGGDDQMIISNLVVTQTVLPAHVQRTFYTDEASQDTVLIKVYQNDVREDRVDDLTLGQQIAEATLSLPPGLPANSEIEVTCEIDKEGLLIVTAKEVTQGGTIDVQVDVKGALTPEEMAEARQRSQSLAIN
jgi:molecular chaperone DnaK (HSP70)